ncbi:methyltransferase family protein [Spirosoma foliorum]|uniref:Isoprenylcysteine carboxylmethyltransferase family protein n=1 Tax=Spirosoma foliorum TaxID=2710596 RepID=A0A7G5GNX9_9BACT|nr:isoprenylcysteine carboxylmethyltransferase family protein [Spirosoma foliorum]QMW00571.1 isoprenylcysteine carboxylmethyltransferase family protein [Spirosoma foliorum]
MDQLTNKAVKGVVGLTVSLGLLIFLPAWTIHYWQGWAYLIAFCLPTLLITLYLAKYDQELLARRVDAGPSAETEKSQQYIQAITGLLALALVIVSVIDWYQEWSRVSSLFSIIADGLILVGFYIVFRVFQENSYTIATIKVDTNQSVTTTGPYAIVRHPMYSGAFLIFIATPPALGSYWALLISILLTIGLGFRAVDEERFLVRNLQGYSNYCQTTKYRLIPFVW